ncbi:non-homologous end-joining DNA ligase [Rudaeicoccus suwonensis]|uniref:Bifunctional non-homologous end joining protein LigD n=1 Tax=Rudaeicoccus suwonensis TaxID=657409 RepID=A0A561E2W5_9MICO|nr:non-homologous end-joining DNA ligase [Rudaeicoccus suwonensis]TWE09931.1 bifunctional non-homologous end joining protein LigD [Rudaeicoccus suwonensis]
MPQQPRDGTSLTVAVGGRRLSVSNLDKILYPATETTKGEIMSYYATVAQPFLAGLAGRPVTRVRFPHGVSDLSFFEKNLPPGAPDWLDRVELDSPGSRGSGGTVTYPLVNDLAQLTYLVNLASLEFHVPQWRVGPDGPMPPDRLVIDLDPGAPAGLVEAARLALVIRDELARQGLHRTVPVTSGSKGMQVYAALDGSRTSEEIRDLARELAQTLTAQRPDQVVWKMTRSIRPGRVLLDWSQNTAAKTTIAVYSTRGRDRPTVAAPRSWTDIESGLSGDELKQLDINEVMSQLSAVGDLFASGLADHD